MPAMLLLALCFSLLEARLRLFRAAPASCLSRFPLHFLPPIRERLLRFGTHRRPLEGFRRLTGASLGVLRGLARFGWIVAEERDLLPFADNELQDLLVGRPRAEDDAGDAVPAFLDASLCILPSWFRNFKIIRVSKPSENRTDVRLYDILPASRRGSFRGCACCYA